MNCSPTARVLSGPYAGFTRAEMETEFQRYKDALVLSGSRLQAASVNGQSLSFGLRSDWTLSQWGKNVQAALAQVDPSFCPPSQTMLVRFRND